MGSENLRVYVTDENGEPKQLLLRAWRVDLVNDMETGEKLVDETSYTLQGSFWVRS